MFSALLLKFKGWIIGIGTLLAAIAAAVIYVRFKQKESDAASAAEQQLKQVQEVNKINQQNADVRQSVEETVHELPPAVSGQPATPEPAVKIADANPDSSVGRLQDWARDSSSH